MKRNKIRMYIKGRLTGYFLCVRGMVNSSQSMKIFFFQAKDGIRDRDVTGVQTCALDLRGNGDVMSRLCRV